MKHTNIYTAIRLASGLLTAREDESSAGAMDDWGLGAVSPEQLAAISGDHAEFFGGSTGATLDAAADAAEGTQLGETIADKAGLAAAEDLEEVEEVEVEEGLVIGEDEGKAAKPEDEGKTDKTEDEGKAAKPEDEGKTAKDKGQKPGLVSELVRMRQRAQRAEGQLGSVSTELASLREANAKIYTEFSDKLVEINHELTEALDQGDREKARELSAQIAKVQAELARHSGASASREQALESSVDVEDKALLQSALDEFITAYPMLNPSAEGSDAGAIAMINALYKDKCATAKSRTSAFIDAVEAVVERLNIAPAKGTVAPKAGSQQKPGLRSAAQNASAKQAAAGRTPPAPNADKLRNDNLSKLAGIARMSDDEFDSPENRKAMEAQFGIRIPK